MERIIWMADDELELEQFEKQLESKEKIAKNAGLITFGVIALLFVVGILMIII